MNRKLLNLLRRELFLVCSKAGIEFILEEEDSNDTVVRLALPRHLDTELVDVDAQPWYVRKCSQTRGLKNIGRLETETIPE